MSARFRFFQGWCFCRIVPGSRWATLVFCANCPGVRRFHFAGPKTKRVAGFTLDSGAAFVNAVGFGWRKAIQQSHCRRKGYPEIVQDTSSSHATIHTQPCVVGIHGREWKVGRRGSRRLILAMSRSGRKSQLTGKPPCQMSILLQEPSTRWPSRSRF